MFTKQNWKFLGIFITVTIYAVSPFYLPANADHPNRPPRSEPIHAELTPPVTTFTIIATDEDGDPLTYKWTADISCGTFKAEETMARWTHPHGNGRNDCPEESTSHPGTIYVSVNDGKGGVVQCMYSGSEYGDGPNCETAKPGTNPLYYSRNNSPLMTLFYEVCYWLWLPMLLGLFYLAWWLNKNGLFVNESDPKGPCEKEKRDENSARAKMESAEREFNEIDKAKKSADEAERKAREAEQAADRARRAAGTRWSAHGSTDWEGEHREVHNEGWHNKEAGKKADEATARANEARESARNAKNKFDSAGGESSWSQKNSDCQKARDEWEKAKQALNVCLGQISTPPSSSPTPPPQGGTTDTGPTTSGGGTPSGPNGPSIPTPPPISSEPRRVCIDGERRNEREEHIEVQILDLESVRMMQDKVYSDAGNEAMKFIDYLQSLKDIFMLGKRIKGGVDGYLNKSLTGTGDALDIPDFLTWYDKGIDALTKSMHDLYLIMQDKQRLGDYWLEYQTKRLTLTCRHWEVCGNNRWVKHCELSIEDHGMTPGRSNPQSVHDIRELQPAISRLFIQLRNRFNGDKQRMKTFTDSCNRCE